MAQGRGLRKLTRRLRFSKRTWRVIGIVGGIVALALVVLVSSAISKPKSQPSTQTASTQEIQSETLTDRGITALSANDTATAEALLQRAVALNPNNTRAAAALVQIRQATTSGSTGGSSSGGTSSGGSSGGSGGGGSGSGTSQNTPGPFDKKIDLSRLLPAAVSGYTMYPPQIVDTDAQVSGEPSTRGVRVIWAVHDRGSAATAAKFISAVSKKSYPKNAQTVSIDGATAYLGTDGGRYATAAYVRGRYVFEVIVSLQEASSSAVAQAVPIARDAAVAFPDTP